MSELTLQEVLDFSHERAEKEIESFNGDIPKHAANLIVRRAADLLATVNNVRMVEANEDVDGYSDEEIANNIQGAAVDLLMVFGTLEMEWDTDITDAFERRMETVNAYAEFEEAMQDAETEEEMIEAMDEHMSEEVEKVLQSGTVAGIAPEVPDEEEGRSQRHYQ